MTKKNIILLLVMICFLTVMAISIWGKDPELSSKIEVESITICDEEGDEITEVIENPNLTQKKITVEKSDEYTEENPYVCNFSVKVNPADATDLSLVYEVLKGEEIVEIVQTQEENIHYFAITFKAQEDCQIRFKATGSSVHKTDLIYISWIGSEDGGNIQIPI